MIPPGEEPAWPVPLKDRADEVGPRFRRYVCRLEAGCADEPAAFDRALQQVHRRTSRRWLVSIPMVAAGAAAVWLMVSPGRLPQVKPEAQRLRGPVATPFEDVSKMNPAVVREQVPPIDPGPKFALSVGRNHVRELGTLTLAEASVANVDLERPRGVVTLERGQLDLEVRLQGAGRSLAVEAAPFTFVDLGTTFSLNRGTRQVRLKVAEGKVAVWRGKELLATVKAGGSWTGTIARAELSKSAGPDTEIADYEAAQQLKNQGGDLERAREAFARYRAKHPRGNLSVEASLSLLEILPRLGRYQEALNEAEQLLRDPEAAPREPELHLIRGNILRSGIGDRSAALPEYRAAAVESGPVGDDGAYFYAVCLEELGRKADASKAYESYLTRAGARHHGAAQRRKEAVDR